MPYLQHESILRETPIPVEKRESLYRELLIRIALVILYKLFQSDVAEALYSVTFRGTISTIDRATGREIHPCLIAVKAQKSAFVEMNLSLVDPDACLQRLGGRISGSLTELVPVDPIAD